MRKAIISILLAFLAFQPALALAQTDYRFTGQELDRETSLYDYGARNYQLNTGRFIQQDPALKDGSLDVHFLNNANKEGLNKILSNPQRLNPYSYANNNPIKYIDPTGETPITPYDMTTDVMFFNQSLSDYRENKSFGNTLALAADTLGVMLPVLPAGTGGLFKGFIKGVNYLTDIWKQNKILRVFKNAENIKNSKNLANFVNINQLLENYSKHKSSLGGLSLKEYSNKAQDLYQRFTQGKSNILSGFKGEDRVLFDKNSGEFSIITPTNIIKTYYQPTAKDKMQYFLRNIDRINQ